MPTETHLFGFGRLYLVSSVANATPKRIADLKGVALDHATEVKSLVTENFYPVDATPAGGNITGKIDSADFSQELLRAAMPWLATATGGSKLAFEEQDTIPGTPYQLVVDHAADFQTDLGVYDVTSGVYLTKVASAPATGQYSVSAGTYTFAAADTGHIVRMTYRYNVTTTPDTLTASQHTAEKRSDYYSLYLTNGAGSTDEVGIYLPKVVLSGLPFAFKDKDFTSHELSFIALPDSTGKIMEISHPR